MKAKPAVIVRYLAHDIVEVVPAYDGEPVLRIVDPYTGELIRMSCSDAHNDRVILALMEVR